jgi:hypothetical protein
MTPGDRAAAIVRDWIGQQAFTLAQMQAEVEALRVENEALKQKVAELEVKATIWRQGIHGVRP